MKIKSLLTALMLFASSQIFSQTIFAELGGPGLASVNFDSRFSKKDDGIGGRVGIGGLSIDHSGVIFIPLGVNYLLSKDQKNYFELGGGITPVILTGDFNDDDGTFTTTFGHLWIGYRLQPKDGGLSFRAGINPVFGNGFFIPYYAGVSIGYKF